MIFGGCDIFSSNERNFSSFIIETDQEMYTSDQRIEVSVINNNKHTVLFYNCATMLQRFENDGWSDYSGVICPAVPEKPMEINAGEKFSQKLGWFGNEYEEGDYRVVFAFTDKDGEELPFEKRVTRVLTVTN
jgi:hypothetical protein